MAVSTGRLRAVARTSRNEHWPKPNGAIAGQAERFDLFSRIKHLPFPGGALLRTPALMLGMLYYRLHDLL